MELSDEELRQALRRAERQALRQRVEPFAAADIAQESVMKLQAVEPAPQNWQAYLSRIVAHKITDHFRRQQRVLDGPALGPSDLDFWVGRLSTSDCAMRAVTLRNMFEALATAINATEMRVMRLTAEGYTGDQIAELVGLKNADSVKAIRNRARRKAAAVAPQLRELAVHPRAYGANSRPEVA